MAIQTEEVGAGAATKEFFVPVILPLNPDYVGFHCGDDVDAQNEGGFMEFRVPGNFSSLTSVYFIVIARATATHRWNLGSEYASDGENYNAHAESESDVEISATAAKLYKVDASGILSSIVAGDYVGMRCYGDSVNTPDALVLGAWFKYS